VIFLTNTDLMHHWIETADNDYETMKSLYDTKHYNWCLFIGHLVIEKYLKGLYAKLNVQKPYAPKIHNLLTLAEKCNLELEDDRVEMLSLITKFNMSARYDSAKKDFRELCTPEFTEQQVKNIEELRAWLKQELA